jgi:hypothetical protein
VIRPNPKKCKLLMNIGGEACVAFSSLYSRVASSEGLMYTCDEGIVGIEPMKR